MRNYEPEYTAPAEWTLLLMEFTPRFCAHDPTVYVPAGTLPEPFAEAKIAERREPVVAVFHAVKPPAPVFGWRP